MNGYAASPMTLEIRYPGGIKTDRFGTPKDVVVRSTITRGTAMATYPLRQFEALINGNPIVINGAEIRAVFHE